MEIEFIWVENEYLRLKDRNGNWREFSTLYFIEDPEDLEQELPTLSQQDIDLIEQFLKQRLEFIAKYRKDLKEIFPDHVCDENPHLGIVGLSDDEMREKLIKNNYFHAATCQVLEVFYDGESEYYAIYDNETLEEFCEWYLQASIEASTNLNHMSFDVGPIFWNGKEYDIFTAKDGFDSSCIHDDYCIRVHATFDLKN